MKRPIFVAFYLGMGRGGGERGLNQKNMKMKKKPAPNLDKGW